MIVIRNAHEQEAEVLAAIGLRAWRQATAALGITPTLYDNAASAFSNFTRSTWLAIRVAEFGGSFSAEHGIGALKADKLEKYQSPVALSMMRAIKQALDPQGLMNPGCVLLRE